MVSRKGLDPNLKQRITEPSITPAKLPHMPDHVMQMLKAQPQRTRKVAGDFCNRDGFLVIT